jgi:hypothetical protein
MNNEIKLTWRGNVCSSWVQKVVPYNTSATAFKEHFSTLKSDILMSQQGCETERKEHP